MNEYIIVTRHHLTFNNIPIGSAATPIPIQLGGQSKILLPISSICEFGKRDNDNYSIIVYRYAPPSSTLAEYYVKESPPEIEALIMGKDTFLAAKPGQILIGRNEKGEPVAYGTLNDNLSCDSSNPIDYLKDQINKAVNEISKLEEENAKLKDALSDTQKQLEIMVKYSKDKFHSGEHSNEENAKLKDELYSLTFATIRTGMFADLDWGQLSERLQHSNPANPCCRETFAKLNGYYNGANINYFCASQDELDKRGELEVWRQAFKDKIQENKND